MKEIIPMDFVPKNSRLSFIKFIDDSSQRTLAIYKCECGTIKQIATYAVKMGITRSCGCIVRNPNSLYKHPLWGNWKSMISRCYNNKSRSYKYYGAEGVIVCEEWRKDFKSFFTWATMNGWQYGLQIDKDILYKKKFNVPSGKLYSPEFCQFVTPKENNRNSRRSMSFLKVLEIRKTFATGDYTYKQISEMFKMKLNSVGSIVNNRNWKDL